MLPYNHNRVRLRAPPGERDYLNALLVESEGGEALGWRYIVAQVCAD